MRNYVSRDNVENGDDAVKASCPQPRTVNKPQFQNVRTKAKNRYQQSYIEIKLSTTYCQRAIVSECENQGLEINIEIKLSLSSSLFFQNVRTHIFAI